jgi:hypothetical protein
MDMERRELLMTIMSNIVELMVQEWAAEGRPERVEYPNTYLDMLDTLSGLIVVHGDPNGDPR